MKSDEMKYKQELLDAHRRRLYALSVRAAQQGVNTDPVVTMEIESITSIVEALESEMFERAQKERLIFLCDQITDYADKSLRENQDILTEFFVDTAKREETSQKITRLYHNQENIMHFGNWKASLEAYTQRETNTRIKKLVENLIGLLELLEDAFYSHQFDPKTRTKCSLVNAFKANSGIDDTGVFSIANDYLALIRELVGNIAYTAGQLQEIVR